ncbi:MAG: serine hydroxymethyltransferase [Proteobacteria bacterium]|nr:serine hydroxymethyltransferase [Pseudomonadota bacterium]NBP13776.1 serine hydroxymethyltransferase [bacterium]
MPIIKLWNRITARLKARNQARNQPNDFLFADLSHADQEVHRILTSELSRQTGGLELIASENFTSRAVMQANGTVFTNKYSEGYPGKRYYGGNRYIDELELLCQQRALTAYGLDPSVWGVNVQSYSGSTANFSVYTALLKPGDRLMGLDLPSGGHLTHGYATPVRKISNSAIYFNSQPYRVSMTDFLIDYDYLTKTAAEFKPQLIIVGASAYPRDYDYARFRAIADQHHSFLMADIAHTSGLVASGLLASPFEFCDVVTTTTHKTLRGPRAALIFYRLKHRDNIDFAVFPSSQGGPHNNTIAAIAVALGQVCSTQFKEYSAQTILNAKCLASKLIQRGFEVVTGGTDNHIVLVNLKTKGITGSKFEKIAEMCHVSVNKNTIATDKSALNPSGIRLGTSAMTTRGFIERDFVLVAEVIDQITGLCQRIQQRSGSTKLVDFLKTAEETEYKVQIENISRKVQAYCNQFPLPV